MRGGVARFFSREILVTESVLTLPASPPRKLSIGVTRVPKIMKTFFEKDSLGNWNTLPPVPEDKIKNVNCHRFILYLVGKMTWEEMTSDAKAQKEAGREYIYSKQAMNISNEPFYPVNDKAELYSLADIYCKIDETYIGQILDTETDELAHSFLSTRELDNKYSCFDKPGFLYPFKIYELGELLDFVNKDGEKPYRNQKWRFITLK